MSPINESFYDILLLPYEWRTLAHFANKSATPVIEIETNCKKSDRFWQEQLIPCYLLSTFKDVIYYTFLEANHS